MKRTLSELLSSQSFCEIFANHEDTSCFDVGRLIGFDDDYVVIESVGSDGISNGLIGLSIENIIKIQTGTDYLKEIKAKAASHGDKRYQIDRNQIKPRAILKQMLSYANTNSKVVTLELCDSGCDDVVGYVRSYETKEILIDAIDDNFVLDGKSLVLKKFITRFTVDLDDWRIDEKK